MSYKHSKQKNGGGKHRQVNASRPSLWPLRLGVIGVIVAAVLLGGYVFPSAWNVTAGQIPGLQTVGTPFRLGLDLLGGTHLVYEADVSDIEAGERDTALESVRDVIERRVNAYGVAEPLVQTTQSGDSHRVIVELAGVQDVNEAIRQIGETPILEFKAPALDPTLDIGEDQLSLIEEQNVEAEQKAEAALDRVQAGEDIGDLAREISESAQGKNGGISIWVDDRDDRYAALPGAGYEIGDLLPRVLETDDAFRVTKYIETRNANEWQYNQIRLCYLGATNCPSTSFPKNETQQLANRILGEITPENFVQQATLHSVDRDVPNGDRGWVRQVDMDVNLAFALDRADVGEIVSAETAEGIVIAWKRGERPYPQYKFQEVVFQKLTEADFLTSDIFWEATDLNGAQLKRAAVEFDPNTGVPHVLLQFDSEGADLFEQLTEQYIGQQIAIFLDGEVISAPVVQSVIYGGEAIITGAEDVEEAKELARRLNAGALPVPIELISQQTVGPTLGAISLERSLSAAVIGLVLVAIFMLFYYRLPGLLSILALAAYAILVLTIFKVLPVTLTLSGLAGFILSVGMAVDANVLIFERLKEELRAGRHLDRAIDEGFKRAWTSIRDGNITTLIACVILYFLSSSFIQGFALTLGIGVLVSMFSAVVITRVFLKLTARWKFLHKAGLYGVKEMR